MQQVGEESRAQPDSPKLVPTTSTLQASRLGQVGEEWPSCFPFFFPLNPLLLTDATTAMESFSPMGCCWVPPQMLHWTLRGAQPLMAGSGPVAPPNTVSTFGKATCEPLPWDITLSSSTGREGRSGDVPCPPAYVCEALMLLCPATRIIPALKIVVWVEGGKEEGPTSLHLKRKKVCFRNVPPASGSNGN